MKTSMSATAARKLTQEIKRNFTDLERNLQKFHAAEGWIALGYDSFTLWWDAELRGIQMATSLRNWVITQMLAEYESVDGRISRGGVPAVAHAVDVSNATVKAVRTKYRTRMSEKSDDDTIAMAVPMPNRWRRHIMNTATNKNMNMSDILRPIIFEGMKRKHHVNLDEPIEPTGRRKR